MSIVGERKSALLLASLSASDRRWLLNSLPRASSMRLRALIEDLGTLSPEARQAAQELLNLQEPGNNPSRTPDLQQLTQLASVLPPEWFAKALAAWPGIDRAFVLRLLDKSLQPEVRRALRTSQPMPAKLAEALRSSAIELTLPRAMPDGTN